jgi:putative flavoprotein involved in K+ transport
VSERLPVVVIGAGQAGLSVSYLLTQRGIDHVVFEKHRTAHAWRAERWDSFCLVTPNWQCTLPGFPYRGDDPDGFMVKDDIVAYLDAYAASFDAPVHAGVAVTNLRERPGGFVLTTSSDEVVLAEHVVVAVGGYHRTTLPRLAERFGPEIVQLHSSAYKNPAQLPAGAVLVVGSGQSGAQIAEDLHLAGRTVHLCTGSAPRTARRYRGRDIVAWLDALGHYRLTVDEHPLGDRVRDNVNHYVTGRDGGRDIDLRAFARDGMQLYGRLTGVDGTTLRFAGDLAANLDHADAVAERIKSMVDTYIEQQHIDAPEEPRYRPVWEPEREVLACDLAGANISAVIWCVGYGSDYRWIDVPVFDGSGYPRHRRGVTSRPGLSFVGLPWQYTWGSGRFSGVAQDAAYVVDHIAEQQLASVPTPRYSSR